MEIYPGYLAYSLRIDCSHNEHNETEIQKMLDDFEIEYYLFGRELSDKLKKPHYQGIVWKKAEFEKKALLRIRAHIKNKLCDLPDEYYDGNKKQTYSFKRSTDPDNLLKYCGKDEDIFTNVDTEKRELAKGWVPKEQYVKKNAYTKKKELIEKIQALPKIYRYDWLHEVIKIYVEVMGNLPRTATLDYYQYKYWLTNTEKKARWLEDKYNFVFGYAKEEKHNEVKWSGTVETGESDDDGEEYYDEYTEKKTLPDYYQ